MKALDKKTTYKIYVTIICISFLQGLQYGPSPILRQISEHFPTVNTSLVQMLITGPSLVGMFCALLSGMLVTKISKKQLLLLSSLISGISGILPLFFDSFPLLFGCRLVYGFAPQQEPVTWEPDHLPILIISILSDLSVLC